MIKKDYIKELKFPGDLKKGAKGKNAGKVQEWLNLNIFVLANFECECAIDDDFGPQTQKAVKVFQEFVKLPSTGIVDDKTWEQLTMSMITAFSEFHDSRLSIREHIVQVAKKHILSVPRELKGRNEGPWVRAYMGGHDGQPWAWCVGSALMMLDQALSVFDQKFTDYYPNTYSCDVMGSHAKKKKTLIRNKKLREMSLRDLHQKVQPGDILQIVKTPTDWTHCAIILGIHDNYFVTAEGNTNDEGSREGFEFVKRKRDFRKQNLDVLTLNLDEE